MLRDHGEIGHIQKGIEMAPSVNFQVCLALASNKSDTQFVTDVCDTIALHDLVHKGPSHFAYGLFRPESPDRANLVLPGHYLAVEKTPTGARACPAGHGRVYTGLPQGLNGIYCP